MRRLRESIFKVDFGFKLDQGCVEGRLEYGCGKLEGIMLGTDRVGDNVQINGRH
jgi:hypothetical protein